MVFALALKEQYVTWDNLEGAMNGWFGAHTLAAFSSVRYFHHGRLIVVSEGRSTSCGIYWAISPEERAAVAQARLQGFSTASQSLSNMGSSLHEMADALSRIRITVGGTPVTLPAREYNVISLAEYAPIRNGSRESRFTNA